MFVRGLEERTVCLGTRIRHRLNLSAPCRFVAAVSAQATMSPADQPKDITGKTYAMSLRQHKVAKVEEEAAGIVVQKSLLCDGARRMNYQ